MDDVDIIYHESCIYIFKFSKNTNNFKCQFQGIGIFLKFDVRT